MTSRKKNVSLHPPELGGADAAGDGARSVSMKEKRKREGIAARFLMLWTAAVLATAAAFVVHLAMRFETVRLGYEVGSERREQRRLIEQRRLLSVEAATLRRAPRIETVARGVLEMDVPEAERVVPITPQRRSRRASGRVR